MPGSQLDENEIRRIIEEVERGARGKQIRWKLAKELGKHPKTITRHMEVILFLEDHYEELCKASARDWESLKARFEKERGYSHAVTPHLLQEDFRVLKDWKTSSSPQARQHIPMARVAPDSHPWAVWWPDHLKRLNDLVEDIRKCLYNPHLELECEIGPSTPLVVGRNDWRLEPDVWLSIVTPNFDDSPGDWGPLLSALREHMQASPFWRHLEELHSKVEELERVYEEAATRLGERNPRFRAAWDEFRDRANDPWTLQRRCRTPRYPEIPDDLRPCAGPGFVEKALEEFHKMGYDVYSRLRELVNLLQQLNSDLLPDRVEPLIAQGSCEFCRPYRQTP